MQQAVPRAVRLDMIMRHGCVWTGIAQLALRILACQAPPQVEASLPQQKLFANDGRVLLEVLLLVTSIALAGVCHICPLHNQTSSAFRVLATACGMTEVCLDEMGLWPHQLLVLRGAALA